MRLHLIRHPCPVGAEGLCYGRSDLPLAQAPTALSAQLRARLPAHSPCYTSPLQRCRRLAELLDPAAIVDGRLAEMDFGAWEMRPWDAVPRHELDAWAADPLGYAPPGGESVAALRRRVLDFLAERIAAGQEELVLVTHGGIMKILAGLAFDEAGPVWQARRFPFGGLLRLDLEPPLPAAGD